MHYRHSHNGKIIYRVLGYHSICRQEKQSRIYRQLDKKIIGVKRCEFTETHLENDFKYGEKNLKVQETFPLYILLR